jgi:glycine dehydrogenase subunit 1
MCCLISGGLIKAELLVSACVWPQHRQVVETYMDGRGVARHTLPFDARSGRINLQTLEEGLASVKPAGFLFQTPNALGIFEDAKAIAELCARHGVTSVCSFHPLASGIVPSPGDQGVDIVTCDGQSLGLPLNGGGPSLGVFATRREYRKYIPGRLIGKVTDINGNPAYALVYEDREQHVARERATSNICSNQALNALRAVMFLSSIGGPGLAKLAALNARKAHYLHEKMAAIPRLTLPFSGPFFNEFIIAIPMETAKVRERLMEDGIFGGIDYSGAFGLEHALLVTVTETKTRADLDRFAQRLEEAIA